MVQNNVISKMRRAVWRLMPAPILVALTGEKLRGMGILIEKAGITSASRIDIPGVSEPSYQLVTQDGTILVSTPPLDNNVKITHSARKALNIGPEYSKALVDLIVRYSFPHALVPILSIPVPDTQRGGFHLQHRNLPQESGEFDDATCAFLRDTFTPQLGWNVLDIGCYLGHGATHVAKLIGPEGRLLAVEAIPSNAAIATFQLAANGLVQARVLNNAIWSKGGETIHINVTENQANAIASDVISSSDKLALTTTSIADLTAELGQAADLVSLTVNGAEVEAIDSLADMAPEMYPKRMVMPGWYPTDTEPRSDILQAKLKTFGYETLVTDHRFVIAWRDVA